MISGSATISGMHLIRRAAGTATRARERAGKGQVRHGGHGTARACGDRHASALDPRTSRACSAHGCDRHPWAGSLSSRLVAWLTIVILAEPWGRLWGTGQDASATGSRRWMPRMPGPTGPTPSPMSTRPPSCSCSQPIRILPWQAFMAVWTAILLGALSASDRPALAGRRRPWSRLMELAGGNISSAARRGHGRRVPLAMRRGRSSCSRRSRRASACCGSSSGASGAAWRSRSAPRPRSWPCRSSSGPMPGSSGVRS